MGDSLSSRGGISTILDVVAPRVVYVRGTSSRFSNECEKERMGREGKWEGRTGDSLSALGELVFLLSTRCNSMFSFFARPKFTCSYERRHISSVLVLGSSLVSRLQSVPNWPLLRRKVYLPSLAGFAQIPHLGTD